MPPSVLVGGMSHPSREVEELINRNAQLTAALRRIQALHHGSCCEPAFCSHESFEKQARAIVDDALVHSTPPSQETTVRRLHATLPLWAQRAYVNDVTVYSAVNHSVASNLDERSMAWEVARALYVHAIHTKEVTVSLLEGRPADAVKLTPDKGCFAIVYEDASVRPELLPDDSLEYATKVFRDRRQSWNCHLFVRIFDGAV